MFYKIISHGYISIGKQKCKEANTAKEINLHLFFGLVFMSVKVQLTVGMLMLIACMKTGNDSCRFSIILNTVIIVEIYNMYVRDTISLTEDVTLEITKVIGSALS